MIIMSNNKIMVTFSEIESNPGWPIPFYVERIKFINLKYLFVLQQTLLKKISSLLLRKKMINILIGGSLY